MNSKELRKKVREQEERLSKIPKVTPDNPFPDHEAAKDIEKYTTKPDPKSLRTNPKGGCDY
jgi:hypothetical protein